MWGRGRRGRVIWLIMRYMWADITSLSLTDKKSVIEKTLCVCVCFCVLKTVQKQLGNLIPVFDALALCYLPPADQTSLTPSCEVPAWALFNVTCDVCHALEFSHKTKTSIPTLLSFECSLCDWVSSSTSPFCSDYNNRLFSHAVWKTSQGTLDTGLLYFWWRYPWNC